MHRRSVDDVHFHEVGGHDAIIDIVGTAAALEVLGVDEITASSVALGTGMVRAAHGMLPNPSPAAVRLLDCLLARETAPDPGANPGADPDADPDADPGEGPAPVGE